MLAEKNTSALHLGVLSFQVVFSFELYARYTGGVNPVRKDEFIGSRELTMSKRVKLLALLLALLMALMMALSGCSQIQSLFTNESTTQQDTQNAIKAETNQVKTVVDSGLLTVSYDLLQEDTDCSWDKNTATTITFNKNTAQISGSGAGFSGGTLLIGQAGTYVISGTLENGQILIDAGKNDVVRLVLNDLTLHNEGGPAIYAPKAKKVVIILEKGTQNTVSDGSGYVVADDDNANAAIFVKNDLSITGEGKLTVTGNNKHGIRTQDYLTIAGGTFNVTAAGDALRGRDGIVISDGSFTLKAGSDGICSNNDVDDSKGFVVITGGTFDIKANNDGIQAESSLAITGGQFTIKAGGGSANAAPRATGVMGGGPGGAGAGGWQSGQSSGSTSSTASQTDSMKGLKAGRLVFISGGDFIIDAEDDGVHSNVDILIAAGKLSIKSGDDGIHADNAVEISGGTIDIPKCYEGIEGLTVTISGGDIDIVASDDGINVSQGEGKALNGGRPAAGVNQNAYIRITGGTIRIQGGTDGIDSNGHLYIEGGTIYISGPSQIMEGAIDKDGDFIITGGEIITAGSWDAAPKETTQPVILMSYTQQLPAGTVFAMKDSQGNTILEYTSKVAFSMSGFSSSSFKIGETYSLYINGVKRIDIKLETQVTSMSDTGGQYSGGSGGPGGMGGPGGGQMPGGGQTPGGGRGGMPPNW